MTSALRPTGSDDEEEPGTGTTAGTDLAVRRDGTGRTARTGRTGRTAHAEGSGQPEEATGLGGTGPAEGADRAEGAAPAGGDERTVAADQFGQDSLPTPRHATRKLLASLLRPHRGLALFSACCLLLQQAVSQTGPLLVAYAIDQAVPALRDHDSYGPLVAVAVGYLGCALLGGWLQYVFTCASARVSQRVLLELRGRIYRHAQALSVDFHDRYTSGRLISRSTTDVEALRELLEEGLQELLKIVVSVVYILVTLLCLDAGLGTAALLSFVPLALLVRDHARRSGRAYRRRSTAIAAVIVKFAETVGGIRPVQSFRRERANNAAFAELNARHLSLNGDAMMQMARYILSSRLTANTAIAATVVWGAYLVASGELAVGVLAAAALYLRRLYDPIDQLGMFLNDAQSAAASLEKIAGLLAQAPSVPEPLSPRPLPGAEEGAAASSETTATAEATAEAGAEAEAATATRTPPVAAKRPAVAMAKTVPTGTVPAGTVPATTGPGPRGRQVVFDGVSFSYRPDRQVLPPFSLTLAPGRTTAVVGATGAGKSTLAKLLARFYDPTQGRVLLDGVDLRDLDNRTLRRGVVMVTQEAFLFSGTVAENIALGRPDASRAEIERAAASIGAHEFITALPDGYDTDVRKRGSRISAGQRQLVAFARALLADPAVLVLDEATSSLDIPGERAVQHAMETVLRGRTAVLIAHRLSTVRIADRVLVMEDGHIVEDGPPAELIAGTGRFAALHQAWRDSLV